MSASFNIAGEYRPDMLLAGPAELLSARVVTIAEGQILPRGAVLGMTSATTQYRLCAAIDADDQPITDGSQVPDVILAEAVDSNGGPQAAIAFSRGDFAAQALTMGPGRTLETITEPLRMRGITILQIVE